MWNWTMLYKRIAYPQRRRNKMSSLYKALLSLCTLFIFIACESTYDKPTLKVGISPWPGYKPLLLAAEKGFFEGADIRIIPFATPTESYRALRDGIVDVAAFTADEVFHYAEVRNKPRIFLVLDISNGADAIVASKSIKTLDDLKGKRLGIEGSALGDYVLHRSLDFTKSLKASDMKLVSVTIDRQEEVFKAGDIDAAITYEPSKSLLLKAGAHILFDSSQIPNEIVDVLVANDKIITQRQEELKVLVAGWFKALGYIKQNYTQSMIEMTKNESVGVKEFTKAYEDLIIPSLEDNKKMLGKAGTLISPMKKLSGLMFQKSSLKKKIDVVPLLDDRILNAHQN